MGLRKAGNQGLVTTTAGPDLCHAIPVGRSFIIRKILAYNNTGVDETLIFGTQTNVAGWVPLLPTLLAVDGIENIWTEADLPPVVFQADTTAGAGTTGNALVQASGINLLIQIEVEEIGLEGD